MHPMGHHLGSVAETICSFIPVSPFHPLIPAIHLVTENTVNPHLIQQNLFQDTPPVDA